MDDYKYLDCCGIQEVLVPYEPTHVFEYEKTAQELANEVNGDVVAIHITSSFYWRRESNGEFIGYGVEKDGELL